MVGFNNIIGHEEIIRHLKNAIETEKVSHSYIFTGDPGSGKKLLAGTYAMALQCEEGGTEPCGKCDSCKKAIGKNHPDIINFAGKASGFRQSFSGKIPAFINKKEKYYERLSVL